LSSTVTDSAAYLFKPQTALRVRWDTNTDTPIPPDEPAGQNPPDGAILNYYLGPTASGAVTLEILDTSGALVRRYSSTDKPEPVDPMLAIPRYWLRPPQILSSEPGLHRFIWDMHYTPLPKTERNEYPMQAVVHNTPAALSSPWVMPGQYTVRLTAGGQAYTQPLVVKMNPRVKTPGAGLLEQFTLSMKIYTDLRASITAAEQLQDLRNQLTDRKAHAEGATAATLVSFDTKAVALEGQAGGPFGGRRSRPGPDTLNSVNGQLIALMNSLQEADVTPTTQMAAAVADRRRALAVLMGHWATLRQKELPALNAELKQAGLAQVALTPQSSK
jgi:hypothetical protein